MEMRGSESDPIDVVVAGRRPDISLGQILRRGEVNSMGFKGASALVMSYVFWVLGKKKLCLFKVY